MALGESRRFESAEEPEYRRIESRRKIRRTRPLLPSLDQGAGCKPSWGREGLKTQDTRSKFRKGLGRESVTSSTRALWLLPLWEWRGGRSCACKKIGCTEGSAAVAAWRSLLCSDATAWDRKDNDRKI